MEVALHDLHQILASPTLLLLSETERHADVMTMVVEAWIEHLVESFRGGRLMTYSNTDCRSAI